MSKEKKFRYLLDANVFIEAHRRYYAFDIVPAFWSSLLSLHESDEVLSIDRVRGELAAAKDVLADWAIKTAPITFSLRQITLRSRKSTEESSLG